MTSETARYTVDIILSTNEGELPTDLQVADLVNDQMAGELDETTGLACLAVCVVSKSGNLDPSDDDAAR